MLIIGLIFGIVVCYVVPSGGLVVCMRKKKGTGKAFLIGAAAFVISQLVIRIPILQLVLPQYAWFTVLQLNPWAYGIFLGLSAGIFEEAARWIGIRFFLKEKREVEHGLAFGFGHGGIEAMILVGLNYVAGLVMLIGGQGALVPVEPGELFMAAVERLYAIGFHVGATLLVLYGIRSGKTIWYLMGAILLHTVMDAAIVILPAEFGVGTFGVWVYGGAIGVLTLAMGLWCFAKSAHDKKVIEGG